MSFSDFIDKVKKIENIVNSNDFLRKESKYLKNNDNGERIKSIETYKSEYDEIMRENRLLRIAILGCVKAGKSSFLNALLFGGEEILPQAATPMTAALSKIEYAEQNSVEAEFYSQKDLDEIATKVREYESKLQECVNEKFAELKEREAKKVMNPAQIDESKLRQNARELVENYFKRVQETLFACYEQNELIKKSSISLSQLEANKDFSGDLEAIRTKLSDYVGESGKYMPFTKSITLRLNNPFLQNVEIVDTPGLNDPVPSRSKRTLEFLDKVDVAIVLSSASHFASSNDMELLNRLCSNATAKVYFVASKADNALMGGEYSKYSFGDALNALESELSEQFRGVLGNKHGNFLQKTDGQIIALSSICANIAKGGDLGKNEQFALENLSKQFPKDFNSANKSKNLKKLANMERLESIFESVKKDKEQILAKVRDEYVASINATLQRYKDSLIERIKEQNQSLKTKNVEQIKAEIANLTKAKERGELTLNDKWDELSGDFVDSLKETLILKANEFFKNLKETSEGAKGSDADEISDSVWYNPFSWGRTKKVAYKTINANAVRGGVLKIRRDLESLLNDECHSKIKNWRLKDLQPQLLRAVREKVDDSLLDDVVFGKATKKVISTILDRPKISFESRIPDFIKGADGTLTHYQVDEFIKDLEKFCVDFEDGVRYDITELIATMRDTFDDAKLGEIIFAQIDSELAQLQSDLQSKALALDTYKNLQKQLEEVK